MSNMPCIVFRCNNRALNGKSRCSEHYEQGFYSMRAKRLPGNWNQLRMTVLHRDKFVCYLCGKPGADGVDHVVRGDDHSLSNLKSVHHNVEPYCHRYKTAQEAQEARLPKGKPLRW